MRIEISAAGDGTNVFVELLEDLGGTFHRAKSFFTSDHRMIVGGPFHGFATAEGIHNTLYQLAAPPVIGGEYAHLHPYWQQHPEQKAKLDKLSTSASLSDISL